MDSALLLRTVEARCEIVPSKEQAAALVAVAEQSMNREMHENPDIRWGLLVGSENSQHSIFLDGKCITGTGRRGTLNGSSFSLGDRGLVFAELAAAATRAVSGTAMTFNTAELSQRYSGDSGTGVVISYNGRGDFLGMLQDIVPGIPSAAGQRTYLPADGIHSMSGVCRSMGTGC